MTTLMIQGNILIVTAFALILLITLGLTSYSRQKSHNIYESFILSFLWFGFFLAATIMASLGFIATGI